MKLLPNSYFLSIDSSTWQLLISKQLVFRKTNLFKIKLSTEGLLFKSKYCYIVTNISESYFLTKLLLQKRYFLQTAAFWNKLVFNFPQYLLFLESFFFKIPADTFTEKLLFHNILFRKRYLFTVTLPFHS